MNAIAPKSKQAVRPSCRECKHGEPMFEGGIDASLWRCFQQGRDESAWRMRADGACGHDGKLWEAK